MEKPNTPFHLITPTLDNYWRAIILFGRNSASYKFALAKSLLEIASKESTFVTLEELAIPFSKHICDHLRLAPRQGTSKSSRFIKACEGFNSGDATQSDLIDKTVQFGFENVIDAFHVVNQEAIQRRFFVDDRKSKNGITVTDSLFDLKEVFQFQNLPSETEARWRLVETAWSIGISPHLIMVQKDPNTHQLFVLESAQRRTDVTSCRDALNGYQRGKCFYSFGNISVLGGSDNLCDVDHFFPHALKPHFPEINLDGVWNLVLSSKECNRGECGKMARVPDLKYLERLHKRNSYLIDSHHPLRETLINQTGKTETQRKEFLQRIYDKALRILIHRWNPPFEYDDSF